MESVQARCGLAGPHVGAPVMIDAELFDALRADGWKTLREKVVLEGWRESVESVGDETAARLVQLFMMEDHAANGGVCVPEGWNYHDWQEYREWFAPGEPHGHLRIAPCQDCGPRVVVSNGEGESVFTTWDTLATLGYARP